MVPLAIIFCIAATVVLYAYVAYPLLVAGLAAVGCRPVLSDPEYTPSVTVIVAARNEEMTIRRCIDSLSANIEASRLKADVIVVSDGSTDRTAALARQQLGTLGRVIELSDNVGKAVALNEGCAASKGDIIVFADARQTWTPEALKLMVENFADPSVGAVSGELVLRDTENVVAGVGLYWRFEKWLRSRESHHNSMVSVTGAISAVRRLLFQPIPAGIILDDVWWPLVVAMQGYRVIFEKRAIAFDRLPEKTRDEFRRKVRTGCGNFQLLFRLPGAMIPSCNPVYWQFVSHKVLRLLVPWALLIMLIIGFAIPGQLGRILTAGQCSFYLVGMIGFCTKLPRMRLTAGVASFIVLNAAFWVGFWLWAFGKEATVWRRASYERASISLSQQSSSVTKPARTRSTSFQAYSSAAQVTERAE